ncbi:MAG: hypothetical protein IJE22_00275 [Oscillibacter sp.]|nr:hypothetical protein [Oscillibacter sp.]
MERQALVGIKVAASPPFFEGQREKGLLFFQIQDSMKMMKKMSVGMLKMYGAQGRRPYEYP